jgi:hypothetical protein
VQSEDTHLEKLTRWTGHVAPFLAAGSGALALAAFSTPKLNWAVAAVGLSSGIVWWLDYSLRSRVAKQREQRLEKFERTPPAVEYVEAQVRGETLYVAIRSVGLVPFACDWVCVTTANAVVGGISVGADAEIFPQTSPNKTLVFPYAFQRAKIVDNYLQLHFRYRSLFGPKYGNPKELGQQMLIVAWRLDGTVLTRIDPKAS